MKLGRPVERKFLWRLRGRVAYTLVCIAVRIDFAVVAFMAEAISIAMQTYVIDLARKEEAPPKKWPSHLN